MTRNEKKAWLWRYQASKEKRIRQGERCIQLEQEIRYLEEMKKRCGTEKEKQRKENAIRFRERQMERMDIQWQRFEDMRVEAWEAIAALNDEELRGIMEERYLDGKQWKDIAAERCYSSSAIYQKHCRALDLLRLPAAAAA